MVATTDRGRQCSQHTFPSTRTRGGVGIGTFAVAWHNSKPCYSVPLSFYLEWPDILLSLLCYVSLILPQGERDSCCGRSVLLSHWYSDGALSLIAALVPPAKQTAACCLASEIPYMSRQKGWATLLYCWEQKGSKGNCFC